MADDKKYSDHKIYGKLTADTIEIAGKYTLPNLDGALQEIIITDGLGNLSFADIFSLGALGTANFISGTGTTWQTVGANLKVNVSLAPFSTTNLSEGSNLYFTNERADDRISALIKNGTGITWAYNDGANSLTPTITLAPFDTDDLAEGVSNLYYEDEYVDDRVAVLMQPALIGVDPTNPLIWTYVDGLNQLVPTMSLAPFDTDALSEGATNIYYSDELVDDRVAALMTDTATITWIYNDIAGTLEANAAVGITGIEAQMDAAVIGTQVIFDFVTGKNMEWQISEDVPNNKIRVGMNAILSLENCEDTSIPSPIAGDHLVFDGIRWVNSTSGVAPEVLEDLDDVFFGSPGPQVGDHLVYNGIFWVNETPDSRKITETTSATYYILDTDSYISHQVSKSGTSDIYLPTLSAAIHGKSITIKDAGYQAAVNNITVHANGVSDLVENAASFVINGSGSAFSFRANNNENNWELY